jgi:hypothetical protein
MDNKFQGFEEGKKNFSALPDQFFSELLPAIDDLNELKVTIYLLWSAYRLGDFGAAFRLQDILLDEQFTRVWKSAVKLAAGSQPVPAGCPRVGADRGADRQPAALLLYQSLRGRAAAELFRQGQRLIRPRSPRWRACSPTLQLYERISARSRPLSRIHCATRRPPTRQAGSKKRCNWQ